MKWRMALGTLVVLLFAGVRAAIGIPQSISPVAVYDGHVDVAMAPDGALLVMIDVERPGSPADGLVEQTFRLQGAPSLAYSGPATVTYVKNRLTVQVAESLGWVFTVAGRPMPPVEPGDTAFEVRGIAHLWGSRVHKSPRALLSGLADGSCATSDATGSSVVVQGIIGGCDDCAGGGPGISGCSLACGGSGCSADCDGTSYACCNCGGYCGCCGGVGGGSAHH